MYKEIKHFHPQGLSVPNGCAYQKGEYFNECRINKNEFSSVNDCDGVIVFNSGYNIDTSLDDISHSFNGQFIDELGNHYDISSFTLNIHSSKNCDILSFAENIRKITKQDSLLVRNFRNDKIYLITK